MTNLLVLNNSFIFYSFRGQGFKTVLTGLKSNVISGFLQEALAGEGGGTGICTLTFSSFSLLFERVPAFSGDGPLSSSNPAVAGPAVLT